MPKLIVIYGVNNIGKTTQAGLLGEKLETIGVTLATKTPDYNMEPTGPIIDRYLREGNPDAIEFEEIQKIYSQNRYDFFEKKELSGVEFLIFEDYVGTGVAWGIVDGVSEETLVAMNQGVPKADISILLNGERFGTDREKFHMNEADENRMKRAKKEHLRLAKENDWRVVNANQSVKEVASDIWNIVSRELNLYTEAHAD